MNILLISVSFEHPDLGVFKRVARRLRQHLQLLPLKIECRRVACFVLTLLIVNIVEVDDHNRTSLTFPFFQIFIYSTAYLLIRGIQTCNIVKLISLFRKVKKEFYGQTKRYLINLLILFFYIHNVIIFEITNYVGFSN